MTEKTDCQTYKGPVRQCAACFGHFPKAELVRLVRMGDRVCEDRNMTHQSRGLYVCRSEKCIKKLFKAGKPGRQFGIAPGEKLADELIDSIRVKDETANGNS